MRRTARNNIGYSSYRDVTVLPYDVEYSISKVFEKELELVRNVSTLLDDLKARYDFNVLDLFGSVQTYGLDTISTEE